MASSRPDARSPSPTWWWCPRSAARRSKGRFKRWRVAAGGLADRRDRVLPGGRRIRTAAACSTVPSGCSSRWSPSGYCPACTSGRVEPRRTASAPRPRGQSRMGPDPRRPCGARSRRRRTHRRGGPREAGRGGGGSKRRRRRAPRAGASTKRCRSTDMRSNPKPAPSGAPPTVPPNVASAGRPSRRCPAPRRPARLPRSTSNRRRTRRKRGRGRWHRGRR